jgi:drug/metabolite transporter (DMT)-like permease
LSVHSRPGSRPGILEAGKHTFVDSTRLNPDAMVCGSSMTSTSVVAATAGRSHDERAAYLGLAFSSLCWASAFIIGKQVVAEIDALPAGALRYAIAAVILLPFAWRSYRPVAWRRVIAPLVIMLICGGVVYQWLFLLALLHTSATNTSLLIALNPIFTVLLAPLVGESLHRSRLAGVTLALGGAAVVITKGDLGVVTGLRLNAGDLLALAAAANWAAFNLASRRTVSHLSPAFTNCFVYGVGAIILFALASPNAPWTQLAAATPEAIGGIVVMAVLASVVAGQLFLVGVRTLGVSRTVVFIYLVPVITAFLSITMLGEAFSPAQAVGGAAVLAGVYWSTRPAA